MRSFEYCFVVYIVVIVLISASNHSNDTNTTINSKFIIPPNILWSRFTSYTCNDFVPVIDIFYNISQPECELMCLSSNYSMECTVTVWYEYVKPIVNDVSRCYLFGKNCQFIEEPNKLVITSFWYYNMTENINCINYPSNWRDNYFDDCHTYSKYGWCQQAYNSSTTAILSYKDALYGHNALKSCCECYGGVFNYDNIYLFEPKWKPTSTLNIHHDYYDDFVCNTIDFSLSIFDEITILKHDRFNFTQFVGLCLYLHAIMIDKYKLLLSINTENNHIINAKDIHTDFIQFKQFNCIDNLIFNKITICNNTDYNNLYPFIIDLQNNHIYINEHYINIDTFIYHLPHANITIIPFCFFSTLLNTTYPTQQPTKEPTIEPTIIPTITSINPTQQTINPSIFPSKSPTTEPTVSRRRLLNGYDSETYFKTNIIAALLCQIDYSKRPTVHPTMSPSQIPTETINIITTEIVANVTLNIDESISESESMDITLIIGICSGIVCFCIIISLLLYYFSRKRNVKSKGNKQGPLDIPSPEIVKSNIELGEEHKPKVKSKPKKKRFEKKGVSKWNNDDILDWIETLNLSDTWKTDVLEAIKNCKCNGKDIMKSQSKNDVKQLFGIDNPMLNNRMWKEIKKIQAR